MSKRRHRGQLAACGSVLPTSRRRRYIWSADSQLTLPTTSKCAHATGAQTSQQSKLVPFQRRAPRCCLSPMPITPNQIMSQAERV
eukprot:CAMPEP_0173451334 /NCGR_PEP_ID=MMETSP1357-20121228/46588_1 /TAXON_ID=77926 /ORGANISM="Hemiselmis rufescens, Strain PCC563" /LENGTH=84 /DNA_ID=CAMNT_0014418085 /DNA_START=38 /DNA_END=292 /DNA_ORIENTATION=+